MIPLAVAPDADDTLASSVTAPAPSRTPHRTFPCPTPLSPIFVPGRRLQGGSRGTTVGCCSEQGRSCQTPAEQDEGGALTSRRGIRQNRQRSSSDPATDRNPRSHDRPGNQERPLSHLDDHAEGLWRDSPVAGGGGVGTFAGTSPSPAQTDNADGSMQTPDELVASPAPGQEDQPHAVPQRITVPDAGEQGAPTAEVADGPDGTNNGGVGSHSPDGVAPTGLAGMVDLKDLELAAERVLERKPEGSAGSPRVAESGHDPDRGESPERGGGARPIGPGCTDVRNPGIGGVDGLVVEDISGQEETPSSAPGSAGAAACDPETGEGPRAGVVEESATISPAENEPVPPAAPALVLAVTDVEIPGAEAAQPTPGATHQASVSPGRILEAEEAGEEAVVRVEPRQSSSFVAEAARAVSPAVCRIDMAKRLGARSDSSPLPFPADVELGQGSGVIFNSEDGLVLTNAHVVSGATKARPPPVGHFQGVHGRDINMYGSRALEASEGPGWVLEIGARARSPSPSPTRPLSPPGNMPSRRLRSPWRMGASSSRKSGVRTKSATSPCSRSGGLGIRILSRCRRRSWEAPRTSRQWNVAVLHLLTLRLLGVGFATTPSSWISRLLGDA